MTRHDVLVAPAARLNERLRETLVAKSTAACSTTGRFSIAIPGGSLVPSLAPLAFDWSRTHVFWVDERAVPPSSPDSNYGVAHNVWLGPAGAPASAIHRMPGEGTDLSGAALAYSEELRRTLGPSPHFDVVMLGVGPDGHVASLFPGHAALAEEERLVIPILDAPKPPPRRLTLSLPLLTGAGLVIVMVMGESKAPAMKEALTRDDSLLPVALVLRRCARAIVLLDEDAGVWM